MRVIPLVYFLAFSDNNNMSLKKSLPVFFISVFCLATPPIFALDTPVAAIEDDSSVRAALRDQWFLEAPAKVLGMRPLVRVLPGGDKVQVRVDKGNAAEFGIVLARELNGAYPGWAQGSWILTRRKDTGDAVRIRAFPRSDPYIYVQFRPLNESRSLMDVVTYDAYLVRSMPVPFSFERLMTLPLNDVLAAAGDKFPRKYFEPDPALYQDNRRFVSSVRARLSGLSFADDGAVDKTGAYVFIETEEAQTGQAGLNCSGFAKWVIDGILHPITGERLDIADLKAPFGNRGNTFTAVFEETRDPFFGLDWIRNLASAAGTTLLSPVFGAIDEFEVRSWRFPAVIRRSGQRGAVQISTESYAGFMEDAGFNIDGLRPLLYTLAIEEPGRFYLAAVNDASGPRPALRQYFHVAVLVPYFTERGTFEITVFESAAETSFDFFSTRYPKVTFVNLVRVPFGSSFDP